MNSIALSNAGAGERVPIPPGTMRISRGGALANVWVGTVAWPKVELKGFIATGLVFTGARVAATNVRFRVVENELRVRYSRGP